ncbi:MAG TPA: NapC/NirT family cytochrome c [Thermoanaerobaculia bacterium]|nr:NapC/NirT family cytochrome c [Thermoanaerobaculia bacterium]
MKPPSLARNLISSLGLVIALIALVNIAFLVFVDLGAKNSNPYVGIFAYVLFPGVLCFGLLLFIAGILRERLRRRRHRPDEVPKYPDIDLNNPHTRHAVEWALVGLSVFILISVVGSYKAYHYTDSDRFCGTTCHEVMHPEYTAYKASPHARVGCVNCHIGPGATWYVKSKMSGAYQVYSAAFHKYSRPIQSPVHNLRPAQETCEQCHWPEKFWGAQLKVFNHYGYDEANTPRETRMLIKTGGGSPTNGPTTGIHWHMNIANEITYVATDEKRQKIEWIRVKGKDGHVREYRLEGSKLTPQQIAEAPKRRMDCVDCHNRPTHIYTPPDRAVDRALLANRVDATLPYIKQQAVTVMTKDYATTEQAVSTIAKDLDNYYKTSYPAVYASKKKDIDRSIAELQQIFQTIRFPEMRVDWRTHPDNIGHFYTQGCFRCHDDQHVSADGKRITKDCQACHTMLGQAEGGVVMTDAPRADFQHPIDLGDLRALNCADCHTGSGM